MILVFMRGGEGKEKGKTSGGSGRRKDPSVIRKLQTGIFQQVYS